MKGIVKVLDAVSGYGCGGESPTPNFQFMTIGLESLAMGL
jgi:hypothetical protein